MQTPRRTFQRAATLRRRLTKPEIHLWCALRAGSLGGLRFRKQHPIGPFILDFYCSAARLAVEVDGATHLDPEAAAYDVRRDAWLARQGIETLRVPAMAVLGATDLVLEQVLAKARSRMEASP